MFIGTPCIKSVFFYIYQIFFFISCRNYTDKTKGIILLYMFFLSLIHAHLNSFSCIKQHKVRTVKGLSKLVHIFSPFCGISKKSFHQYFIKKINNLQFSWNIDFISMFHENCKLFVQTYLYTNCPNYMKTVLILKNPISVCIPSYRQWIIICF